MHVASFLKEGRGRDPSKKLDKEAKKKKERKEKGVTSQNHENRNPGGGG